MKDFSLRLGYQSLLDSSLAAFCLQPEDGLGHFQTHPFFSFSLQYQDKVLQALELGQIDLAVVSLEDVIAYTSSGKSTDIRIVGQLLGGDTRALVTLTHFNRAITSQPLFLAAEHPELASSRWEELSCALDIPQESVSAKHVPPSELLRVLSSGHYNLSELNLHWEGLFGLRRGFVQETVRLSDFGIPTSFSHLLVARSDFIAKNRDSICILRKYLEQVYRELLSQSFSVAERLSQAKIFYGCPDAGFLSASLRVLAPHFEGFLRCKGALNWSDILPFFCWFERRFSHKVRDNKLPYTAIHLEKLLCDSWT